jgi:hypothetical protein
MEQSSTKTLVANNGYLNFKYEGTYGSFQKICGKDLNIGLDE